MTYQISMRYIKEGSKASMIHGVIYSIIGIIGIVIGYNTFGIIGAIVGFIALFLSALYIDQRLTARKLGISPKLMFACIGLDLPTNLEYLADRSLSAYVKTKQNLENIPEGVLDLWDGTEYIEYLNKYCTDYLLLLGFVNKKYLERNFGNELSELATSFENISNIKITNAGELPNLNDNIISLRKKINETTNRAMEQA